MDLHKKKVVVLGAGISGLSTAYALKKMGYAVTAYEKKKQPGGVIQSKKKNDWLVETGPNTIMAKKQLLWNLFDELDITNRIVTANKQAKKRFIVRDGRMHAVPDSLFGFLTTSLFSTSAKFRLLKEPFVAPSANKDKSIASFIKRRLGRELLDYAVNPFTAGVYAGDPETLSVKHTFSSLYEMEQKYGSIFKGFLKKEKNNTKEALISFDEGLQVLIDQLQDKLGDSLKLNHKVEQLERTENEWTVKVKALDKNTAHKFSNVISTLQPQQLSKIRSETHSNQTINKLKNIEYAPVSVIALGFKREQINHPLDGFGFLVPEKEGFNLLGCFFSSSLFPNRAPDNHVLLTCFMGGSRNPMLAGQSTKKLTAKALDDLDQLLNIEGKPVFTDHIYWPQAIPQFNVGYDQYLNTAAKIEKENPGLFIGGNFISGVSVPDCIHSSFETAKRVKKRF